MLEGIELKKAYARKEVLAGVNFRVLPGKCLGVAGHNGSGKSTLLAIVSQIIAPTSGDIAHNGSSILGDKTFMRKMVGYVPQKNGLIGDLTVEETLEYWQQLYGLNKEMLFTPSSLASMFGLEPIRKKKVNRLSGGMQKRVSITLGLLNRPAFVILDEAFSELDLLYSDLLAEYLDNHKKQGGAVMHCSHDVDNLQKICERILVLQEGRVVYDDLSERFPTEKEGLNRLLNPLLY